MRAVPLVLAAQFRQQWRPWLVLSLLIAVVCGFVLAAAAAGRRTASAFPRFVASHGYDAIVYTYGPVPGIAHFPGVTSVLTALTPANGPPSCACTEPIGSSHFALLEIPPAGLARVAKLVAGRMPDQSAPDEVLASFTLAQDKGVHVGTVIRVPLYTRGQRLGPPVALRVVGIEAAGNEFPSGQTPIYDVYTTRAFAAAMNPRTATSPFYYVRLRHGPAGLPRLDASLRRFPIYTVAHQDGGAAAVAASIRPQAVGWWVLAGLAGLRRPGCDRPGHRPADSRQPGRVRHPGRHRTAARAFTLLSLARVAIVSAVGAIAGVALAVVLSPLAPVGVARVAEPDPGVSFDPLVLPLGALAIVFAVLALGLAPAVRSSRPLRAPPHGPGPGPVRVTRAVAAAGAPPSAMVGVSNALERGRDRHRIPVATALAGMVVAVAALGATAVFGASLSHLVASPALYGDPFQVYFTQSGTAGQGILTGSLLPSLKHDPSVDRITLASAPEIAVKQAHVRALAMRAVRGPALLSVTDGRLPAHDGEISLGAVTMRQAGAQVGSVVQVTVTGPSGATHTAPFLVVGRAAFPSDFGTGGLGTGAALTVDGYLDAQCPAGPARPACRRAAGRGTEFALLAHTVPGPAGDTALARYLSRYPDQATRSAIPTALVNFGVSVNFPLILSVLLALFGAATLVHVLNSAWPAATRRRAF